MASYYSDECEVMVERKFKLPLSPILKPGHARFVLTWAAKPKVSDCVCVCVCVRVCVRVCVCALSMGGSAQRRVLCLPACLLACLPFFFWFATHPSIQDQHIYP